MTKSQIFFWIAITTALPATAGWTPLPPWQHVEDLAQRCAACHKVEKGAAHGIGPNLNGIAGKKIASAEGFSYSPALQAKSGVWDDANLNAMIEDPRAFAPGNRMSFAGIKDAGERQAVIDYLKAQK